MTSKRAQRDCLNERRTAPMRGLPKGVVLAGLLAVSAFAAGSVHRAAEAADCGSMPTAGLDWSDCKKRNLILQGSNLEGAKLMGTDFDATDLSNSNLKWANFEKATLVRAWLAGASAEGANFARIEAYRSSFENIVAEGASFVGAELQRASFAGARLVKANFEKAELGRADFEKATLTGASFSLANMSRADLSGAILEGPISLDRAFLYLTRIEGLDLSAATGLEQAQIELACGDSATKLPPGLSAPSDWPCPAEKEEQ
ncbi:pentapeptide repeat-containing protein [Rhizobium sp. BK251]|uniref:pentapeptide repeat-containing protein n=1 Tax=Rhizobium sp. BK251 TaxID=2512125 RepID=UPI0010E19322|nr:pentapeptide repeat-containing protein [Rhizobium sp. BK251]TCL70341.1 uncharacterized protein YjbI with pentapeptide repeats [Rhizobium sp. BK251]